VKCSLCPWDHFTLCHRVAVLRGQVTLVSEARNQRLQADISSNSKVCRNKHPGGIRSENIAETFNSQYQKGTCIKGKTTATLLTPPFDIFFNKRKPVTPRSTVRFINRNALRQQRNYTSFMEPQHSNPYRGHGRQPLDPLQSHRNVHRFLSICALMYFM
jgi:hypothetical protein